MASVPNSQKLVLLEDCGLKVEEDGVVTDWQDSPARVPRPTGQNDGPRAARHIFSAQDDEILRLWCTAAQIEGFTGNRVFERLEAIRPLHTWQAYQNRWRKSLKALPAPDLRIDRPFPGLGNVSGTETEQSIEVADVHTGEASSADPGIEGQTCTYSDQRIETDRVLFQKLGVEDEEGLKVLLRQPWLLRTYRDLVHGHDTPNLTLHQLSSGTPLLESRSHHQWKLDHAAVYLSGDRRFHSRYTAKDPDTTSWTEDDFDIRFLVQVVDQGSARGELWYEEGRKSGWQPLAEKALWLLLWFKWLNKSTSGQGREMQRLQQKREGWLAFLQEAESRNTPTVGMVRTSPTLRDQDLDRNLYLLSDEARKIYQRNRDTRLLSWGVGSNHSSSCILVPAIWASTNSESIAADPTSWLTEENGTRRLNLSVGGFSLPWGRAAAWFECWPRTTTDLQHFLPPSAARVEASQMHGSHRCHHALCIVPGHLLYEDWATNLSRCSCATSAKTLRSYGATIPKYCNKHHPPCFLQHAALTTFECFAMQSNVVRLAKDVSARPPLPRPLCHPAEYATFHQGPAPTPEFPDVGVEVDDIVRLPGNAIDPEKRRFRWDCAFCSYTRNFQKITTYWAHLKADHQQVARGDILSQVTVSAQANQAWAEERFYNYATNNPSTWQKVRQAQASDFSWDVFAGWRLTQERIYAGRSSRTGHGKKTGTTGSASIGEDELSEY